MIFQRGIDTVKITALSNHKPWILNNYIRMCYILLSVTIYIMIELSVSVFVFLTNIAMY